MSEVALGGTKQQVALLIQLRDHPLQLTSQVNAAKAAYQCSRGGEVVKP
ncbi:MAG: hypothetical protein U0401_12525 [Anaerolineae bacterium]